MMSLGIITLPDHSDDLEQGNKLAVLGGDYLLSQACGKLAAFQKPQVGWRSPPMLICHLAHFRSGCRNNWSCHCRYVQS